MTPNDDGVKIVKVGVIGTGLAGLTSAYLLQTLDFTPERVRFQVHIFDKADAFGMDSSSISVTPTPSSSSFRLDTPMRSINGGAGKRGGSHNRVWHLYQHLKIELQRSNFSYSFSRFSNTLSAPASTSPTPPPAYALVNNQSNALEAEWTTMQPKPAQEPLFIYAGSNGATWPPLSIPSTVGSSIGSRLSYLFNITLLAFAYFHLLLLAFFYSSTGLTNGRQRTKRSFWERIGFQNISEETLDHWCRRHKISARLRNEILEPLFAAISTVGRDEVGELPIAEILDYIVSTFGTSHFVTKHGVREIVESLSAPLPVDNVHLSATIHSITPSPLSPAFTRIEYTVAPSTTAIHLDFDYIILATQANQGRRLLASYQAATTNPAVEKSVVEVIAALSNFSYVSTLVVNHWDDSILPAAPDRRDLNLATFASTSTSSSSSPGPDSDKVIPPSSTMLPRSSIQATHIISRTHPSLTRDLPPNVELLQTTNPIVRIAPGLILSSTWYERAKVTVESKQVLKRFLLPDPSVTRPDNATEEGNDLEKRAMAGEEVDGDLQSALPNILFVGSWCAEGIPLLEGCVRSSEAAVMEIARREGVWSPMPF